MTPMEEISDTELDEPETVRTPGRTWTGFPEVPERGEGDLTVEAPDAVEVRDAREDDLFEQVDPHADRVVAAHAGAVADAVVVRIPSGVALEEPVRITAEARSGLYPYHVVVRVGDGASAEVVEEHRGEGVATAVAEVEVGLDATLDHARLSALSGTGYAVQDAEVAQHGEMRWTLLATGGDLSRLDTTTRLAGPRSRLDYRLGFLAAGDQHMDATAHVVHGADHTRCDMTSRGVAMDGARAVYRGVQEVLQGADGTKSFQDEKTVLIGEDAEADTTPQLRIDDNDVEATHAATTGHLDERDLFYMRSRGVDEATARREIVRGMLDDLFPENSILREEVHRRVAETL